MGREIERRLPWTDWQDAEMTRMWGEGASCDEIGARLGKTRNAIAGRRSRLGLPMRNSVAVTRQTEAAIIDRFAELLSEGLDVAEIGRRMNVGRGVAHGYFQRVCRELGAQAI